MRSSVSNPDTTFQLREAANSYYDALPSVVEEYMCKINALTGRNYQLFNYYGAPDATRVIVAMGSVSGCAREVVDALNMAGEKVGFVQVHLYRPFSANHFLAALPKNCKQITVLDRTKEPGANGEPLYEDICSVLSDAGLQLNVLCGRYGLSSKDVTPAQIKAVFDNMCGEQKNHFTVGILDDVTFHSLPVDAQYALPVSDSVSCKFWGLGSDGTVGANKNSIKIIGDNTDQYVQAYFEYDSKKSGGVTKSHLRFGHFPILSTYYVTQADFVACHNQSYLDKYDIITELNDGGTFLLNCSWDSISLEQHLPNNVKRLLASKHIRFYTIDATRIAEEIGLGNRTNSVLQAAFFKLSGILPLEDTVLYMKDAITKTYRKKGERVLAMNYAAVDRGISEVCEITVPQGWASLSDSPLSVAGILPDYVRNVMLPVNAQKGDTLPTSIFRDMADGTIPVATSRYEKRGFAAHVPAWNPDNCIGCNRCALVCPHAAIRPFLLTEEEASNAPAGYATKLPGGKNSSALRFRIQIDPLDCTGCSSCVSACPAKSPALAMQSLESQLSEQRNWDYSLSLSEKENPVGRFTLKGSQFEQPLLEFSGACAGCGETPYMKLLTQLFGERMIVANATGCTQAWGFSVPSFPYCTKHNGRGPALSNSLFENNAEYSLGMLLGIEQQRARLANKISILSETTTDESLRTALTNWLAGYEDKEHTISLSDAVLTALKNTVSNDSLVSEVLSSSDQLVKKSMWMYGGDGWAYDIGYGGLDHVLASGADVNIFIVDTEVYSNTGGQASKATPVGAVAQFAVSGKKSGKKDLGMLAAQYENVYVASVALGADPAQLLTACKEAEAHNGPSVIIAYAPCINHGIVKGMAYAQQESRLAVESGYWFLYRYNPAKKIDGRNPFMLDSKKPSRPLRDFLMGEVRYAALTRTFPEEANRLLARAEQQSKERWEKYLSMSQEQ